MKHYLALSLLVGAFAVALMAVFGDDSYSRLQALNKGIKAQQMKNAELESKVSRMQSEIAALRFDDRELEKIARNDLGLARPNELIFRFNSSLDEEVQKIDQGQVVAKDKALNRESSLKVNESVKLPDPVQVSGGSKSAIKGR